LHFEVPRAVAAAQKPRIELRVGAIARVWGHRRCYKNRTQL